MKSGPVSLLSSVSVPYCQICRKLWQSWGRLKVHYQKEHKLKRIFPCTESLCSCVFISEAQLLRHQQLLHKHQKCPLCPKVFTNSLAMKQHLNTHMGETRKTAAKADLLDIRDVTQRYLRKLRRRLRSCHLDCKGALPAGLKEALTQQASAEDSGTSLALLSFILHASELALKPESLCAESSPGAGNAELIPASPPSKPLPAAFPALTRPKGPLFRIEQIDETVQSEATSPQSHGYSTWDMWAGAQDIEEEEFLCPMDNCKERFYQQDDLLIHLRSSHCS